MLHTIVDGIIAVGVEPVAAVEEDAMGSTGEDATGTDEIAGHEPPSDEYTPAVKIIVASGC
jgi:hypothetical protein